MLGRKRRAFPFALALAGALLQSVPAAADAPPSAPATFDDGVAAFSDGRLEEALKIFQELWKVGKSYDLAVMLGRTERNMEKHAAAAEHYTYALEHFPRTGEEDLREEVVTELAEVKKNLGTLRVRVPVKDAKVTLNGAVLEASQLGQDLFVPTGKAVIEAEADGYVSARRTVDLKPGDTEDVTITLTPAQAATTARSPVPAFVVGGVGLVGIILGGVLIGTAEGKKSEAIQLHDELGSPEGCAANPTKCQSLRDATAAADAFGNGGVAAFVLGGVAGLAAAGYMLIPSRTSKAAPRSGKVSLVPVATPTAGGFVLSGSF
ncbi:MAG: hypothetical protein R3F14_00865 [Polyangiaceae bacterium]